eukprot:m.709787 g.709787  ORF g.709787 m.709787 type:complete len:1460 (-) comp22946_c0_seq1:513-4892(-)
MPPRMANSGASAPAAIALPHPVRPTPPRYSGDRSQYLTWEMLLTNYLALSFGIGRLTLVNNAWSPPIDDQLSGQLIIQCLSGSALRDAYHVASGHGTDILLCLRQKYLGSSALKRAQHHRRLQDVRYVAQRTFASGCERFRDEIVRLMDEYIAYGGNPDVEVVRTSVLTQLPSEFVPILEQIANDPTNDYTSLFDRVIEYAEICDLRRGVSSASYVDSANSTTTGVHTSSRCFTCGNTGHLARSCPTQRRPSARPPSHTPPSGTRPASNRPRDPTRDGPPPTPCRHCKGNHWNRDCPTRRRPQAHATLVSNADMTAPPMAMTPDLTDSTEEAARDSAYVSTASASLPPVPLPASVLDTRPVLSFIVDGACTAPVVNDKQFLAQYTPRDDLPPFITGSGEELKVLGIGSIHQFACTTDGRSVKIDIPNVRYAPQFMCNLLPESLLVTNLHVDIGYTLTTGKTLVMPCGSEVSLRFDKGLHHLDLYSPHPALVTPHATSKPPAPPAPGPPSTTLHQLHSLFGHRHYGSLRHLAANQHWQLATEDSDYHCDVCSRVNHMRRTQFKSAPGFTPDRPGVVLATDYIGPFPAGYGGYDGAIVFIDAYSKASFVYCVRDRTADTFLKCFTQVQLDAGFRAGPETYAPLVVQADTDSVIWSTAVQDQFLKQGIRTRSSPPHVHEQNGLVERHIRTLKSSTRALLLDSRLPPEFWPYALQHAALLLRLSPSRADGTTPYQLHFDILPDVDSMVPAAFGTRCYAYDGRWPTRKSLSAQPGQVATYLGNSSRSKSFIVWPHKKGRSDLHRECDSVIFPHSNTKKLTAAEQLQAIACLDGHGNTSTASSSTEDPASKRDAGDPPIVSRRFWPAEMLEGDRAHSYLLPLDPPANNGASATAVPSNTPSTAAHASAHLAALAAHSEMAHFSEGVDSTDTALVTEIAFNDYSQAKASNDWHLWEEACTSELQSMADNKVFEFVDPAEVPRTANIVQSRMIFATKINSDGSVNKRKARLVAKGYTQRKYIDYFETSAPTPRDSTWRLVLTISATLGFEVAQYDVKTAFLNAELHHEVYMRLPRGLQHTNEHGTPMLAKLHKSLYGLKQSAHEWYHRLTDVLTQLGFSRSHLDQCLYFKDIGSSRMFIVTYVDDLLIAAANTKSITTVADALRDHFTLTGGGPIRSFLGMTVTYDLDSHTVKLCQSGYIDSIADQFPDIKDTKPLRTPLGPTDRFSKCNQPQDPIEDIQRKYRSLLGALIYASVKTRPDIAFAIGRAASVMSNPGLPHWNLLWKIFRYTFHTRHLSLTLGTQTSSSPTGPPFVLSAFSDSDWATDVSSRKSISGYVCKINDSVIVWKSRQQASIALSSSQAETIAASFACREIVYLRRLLHELGFPQLGPTDLMVDSQSTIDSANHPMTSSRMKHVAVSDLWCRDLKEKGEIFMQKISGSQNPADIFTKPLGSLLFDRHKSTILGG